ncbi:hypothetical protein HK101_003263 [Irineochytrium annulatum]|nr:hypothetical protein HK101_003263 [Irineochytrium annulatum]
MDLPALNEPVFTLAHLLSAVAITLIFSLLLSSLSRPSLATPHKPSNSYATATKAGESPKRSQKREQEAKKKEEGTSDDDDDDEDWDEPLVGKRPGPGAASGGSGSGEWKLVLAIRTDLDMQKGKVAAQCGHATLAAYKQMMKRDPAGLKQWEKWGQAKITLKVQSEEEMLDLQRKARALGLVAESILDAGRTQIAAGSRTVLAIGPGPKERVNEVTGKLRLY